MHEILTLDELRLGVLERMEAGTDPETTKGGRSENPKTHFFLSIKTLLIFQITYTFFFGRKITYT